MSELSSRGIVLTKHGDVILIGDESEIRYFWGNDYGDVSGTSGYLAHAAIRSGLFEGIALSASESSLVVVATPSQASAELYGAVVSQRLDTFAQTPVLGSTAFNPEFEGIFFVDEAPTQAQRAPSLDEIVNAYSAAI